MFSSIADWLIAKAKKTPYVHLEGYMNRYWLVPFKMTGTGGDQGCYAARWYKNPLVWTLQSFGVAARVHEILTSDKGRSYHDHPWSYVTIILKGGYYELTPRYDRSGLYCGDNLNWRGPGSILFRPANSFHRLVVPTGRSAWTLFITGPYKQKWGFLVHPKNKVSYNEYFESNHE
jgi:hypothetical protein